MIGSTDMLRRLGSGVRPDGASAAPTVAAIEQRDFDDLLSRAGRGEIRSGRGLRFGAGVSGQFDEATMSLLGSAADAAEAAGARRLLAFVGDQSARIDVESREIRALSARTPGEVLTGFDAAVIVGETSEESATARGPAFVRNAALGEILARGVRGNGVAEGAPRRVG